MGETITVELAISEAIGLTNFLKSVGFQEIRACAVDDDEASAIRSAVEQVLRALGDKGYFPR